MSLPLRLRLTIWSALLLALTLGVFAAATYEFLERQQRSGVDRVLHERALAFGRAYAGEVTEEPREAAAMEAARNLGRVSVYGPGLRLIAGSGVEQRPEMREAIDGAFRGRTRIVAIAPGVRAIVAPVDREFVMVATQSDESEQEVLRRVRVAFGLAIPAALLIAAAGAYFVAGRSLAPVREIAETASRIEAENLSTRIVVPSRGDELGRLAAVLNALFDRLERSFAQQRQLIADTSHELRTPVAVIRSEADVALSRERTPEDYRRALAIVQSESAHLTHLIDSVLMLARADARQIDIAQQPFSLGGVIQESVRAASTLARARGVEITSQIDGVAEVRGDPELVRRMLLNLLDNALKFSHPGGIVTVEARRSGATSVITVTDQGSGISASDQPHIFDRFFRGDRERSGEGTGLGLPIVKWIAELHRGEARLVRSDASGSTFEVTLPDSAHAS